MDQPTFEALLGSPLAHLNAIGIAGIVVWHAIPRRLPWTRLRVASPAQRTPARNEVLELAYRQCALSGLALAPPAAVALLDLPREPPPKLA